MSETKPTNLFYKSIIFLSLSRRIELLNKKCVHTFPDNKYRVRIHTQIVVWLADDLFSKIRIKSSRWPKSGKYFVGCTRWDCFCRQCSTFIIFRSFDIYYLRYVFTLFGRYGLGENVYTHLCRICPTFVKKPSAARLNVNDQWPVTGPNRDGDRSSRRDLTSTAPTSVQLTITFKHTCDGFRNGYLNSFAREPFSVPGTTEFRRRYRRHTPVVRVARLAPHRPPLSEQPPKFHATVCIALVRSRTDDSEGKSNDSRRNRASKRRVWKQIWNRTRSEYG